MIGMRRLLLSFVTIAFVIGCDRSPEPTRHAMRMLALGDSYTIGESVAASDRWPVLLSDRLRERGVEMADPVIIATTGWTTNDLIRAISSTPPEGPFDLVTLLTGVNNQYQRLPMESYPAEFRDLLTTAIRLAGERPRHVLVVSIPDWGAMPFAKGSDTRAIGTEIDAYNAINRRIASELGVQYVDITPISRQATTQPALVAPDGLHPSAEQYRRWVEQILQEYIPPDNSASGQ